MNIKENIRIELTNKVVGIVSKRLTKAEAEILTGVLIDNKPFAQIGKERSLTATRAKQIFERAMLRVNNYIDSLEDRMNRYTEIEKDYTKLESRLAVYEKEAQEQAKGNAVLDSLPPETKKLLKTTILNIDISTRIKKLYYSPNIYGLTIKTVGDLVSLSPNEIMTFRNCGRKTISQIEEFFEKNNLWWGMLG